MSDKLLFYCKTGNLAPQKEKQMAGDKTFSMIKPDAVADGHAGAILSRVEAAGFRIAGIKMVRLTEARAGDFYAMHKGKPFYDNLKAYMSSGPIIVLVLKKENAVADFRKLIGATNPEEAAEGTIRQLYAKSLTANAVHGADSDENAVVEAAFFFGSEEIYD